VTALQLVDRRAAPDHNQGPVRSSKALASISSTPSEPHGAGRVARMCDGCAFCLGRRNLRRTLRIALVVGIVLTAINQSTVIASGHATTLTWMRCALNFLVPFLVSNAGLLSGRG
jgi:hypothetical protein